MRTTTFILVLVHLISEIGSFSYNTRSIIVFTPSSEGNDHSYFGYSNMLKNGENPYIIVGAPRDVSNYENHKNISDPGAIYYCKINLNKKRTICHQKILDNSGNIEVQVTNGGNYKHGKDNMWLGMSMVGSENDGTVIICAPRWLNKKSTVDYFMNGICYPIKNFMEDSIDTEPMMPLVNLADQHFRENDEASAKESLNYYAYGQAGFSSALSDDGKVLILGAPGILHWTGSAIKYNMNQNKYSEETFIDHIVANPHNISQINQDSYLGYSVGIGKFLTEKNKLYVAGAPRGADCKGQVLIFDFPLNNNGKINVVVILNGTQMGEYFGSTITALDINNDNLTDLIIGAPTYSNNFLEDIGRIYVYINNDKGNFSLQKNIICGNNESGARFGSTISSIGDINEDGYLDVAVGAPYEDNGKGAVYIYLGTSDGLNEKYVQRISIDNMFGFGISISKGVDIDNNSCKDIAVGAHDSRVVVLLRCHPSININSQITNTPSELLPSHSNFTTKICFQFEGSELKTELELTLSIDPQHKRAKLNDFKESVFFLSGSNGNGDCKDILINIQEKVVDYSTPIELQLSYKPTRNPLIENDFCADCTILRPGQSNTIHSLVPFSVGCGPDAICSPDLKLTIDTIIKSIFVIGNESYINLNITLQNFGEPAFLPQVQFLIPKSTPLLQIPSQCSIENNTLICRFESPLNSNTKESITVKLDATHLRNSDKHLKLQFLATSLGQETFPENNNVTIDIHLKSIANIDIISKTIFPAYIYIDPKSNMTKNILEKHSYEVTNKGPSLLDSISMRFFFPLTWKNEINGKKYEIMQVFNPAATLNEQLLHCKPISESFYTIEETNNSTFKHSKSKVNDSKNDYFDYLPEKIEDKQYPHAIHINCTDRENVNCLIVECNGSKLLPKTSIAQIPFEIILNRLNIGSIMNNKQSVILSSYAIILNEYGNGSILHSAWAKSLLVGEIPLPSPAPLWIYILSIFLGILTLVIMSYVLYKRGFFRRKIREERKLLECEDVNQES